MNNPQAQAQVQSAQQNKQQQQPQEHKKQQAAAVAADKPRRPMRSDTLGSTGSSRASSCDEPVIVAGRSPPSSASSGFSSANSLCTAASASAAPADPMASTGAEMASLEQKINLSSAPYAPGQLKANPSSCSLDSMGWSLGTPDLVVSQAQAKPPSGVAMGHGGPEVAGDNGGEDDDDDDDDDEDDDEEEDGDEDEAHSPLRQINSTEAKAAADASVAPPFESITLKLKSSSTPPDARFFQRHIDDVISQNEAIMYNWNLVSIRSYNLSSSSAAAAAAGATSAAAAPATTTAPAAAPVRKTSASAYIGGHKRPSSGGGGSASESIGSQQSVSHPRGPRQRKPWSTTVLGDFHKHQQQQQQQTIAPATPSGTTKPSSYSPSDNHKEQQTPAAPAPAPINHRLRQLEQRRSQSHLARKTSEYSLLSVASNETHRLGHHRLSHGSSLLLDRKQQVVDPLQYHQRRFSQDPVQLENGIQNLSLKRKDSAQDEPQKFETTTSNNSPLVQLQLQHQHQHQYYNLLSNAPNQAHITTATTATSTNTSNTTPIGQHFNLDQILGQQQQNQQHHHNDEQLLWAFLWEKNLLEHRMNLGNQAAALLYLQQQQQQQQHHHDNQIQHQQHMIEHQQMDEFRLRQLAAAAASVSQQQQQHTGSCLIPASVNSHSIMDHQMAMMGANPSSVLSLLSSLGGALNHHQNHNHIQMLPQQQQLNMPLVPTGCELQLPQQPSIVTGTAGCAQQVAATGGGSQELRNQTTAQGSGCLPFKKRKISEPIMRYG